MSEPIVVRFTWTEQHYARAMGLYMRQRGQRAFTWFVWAFTGYLLWLAWQIAAYAHGHDAWGYNWPYLLLYLFLAFVMMVVRGPLKGLWMRRQFRSRPDQKRDAGPAPGSRRSRRRRRR